MEDFRVFFKGKKITLMGLGLLGRASGDAAFLAECGAELTVTDLKTKEQLKESLKKLNKYKNIKYVLGKHRLEDFRNCDLVLKTASVPLDSAYINEARKHNIPVEMSAALFAELAGIPIIAVTGTRGKSTVTHLIAHILKSAGKKVILGGNVRGVSNLQLLKKAKQAEIAVLELDSWQLQGFEDNKISPHISVFTTFFPDHMGYYKSNMKKYFADKSNIFKHQKPGDLLIAGSQALPFIKKWQEKNKKKIKSRIIIPKVRLPFGWRFNLPGIHNEYNAVLAIEVARSLSIPDAQIKKALATFTTLPGRLEYLRTVKGVKIYNDNSSTTPVATIAALAALGNPRKKNIILILGGSDKNLDFRNLFKNLSKYVKFIVLIPGNGTNRVMDNLKRIKNLPIYKKDSLEEILLKAYSLAKNDDIILFSPAFASFGMFNNEYDRGDKFMEIVKGFK